MKKKNKKSYAKEFCKVKKKKWQKKKKNYGKEFCISQMKGEKTQKKKKKDKTYTDMPF